ncbi:ras association domain-containing protein 8 [Betta splendens]|uniref:Ras association domain-containing protein 8 n=1 Tax=Betta splendens TaxID=158456 RepID=A0A6P7MZ01_BETSP|nr:ras association domain-containing protein 8 [Betta splendens]
MEVKVFVDEVPRVVCGVTEDTTCQEVVIALAQALGQSGRYTLREKFKDFERCMTPSEHLLETLERYGEQAKEVQLTLIHNGPSVCDEMSRTKVGRYQPCPPLRRKDAGPRLWRGSSSRSLHRQSLPPLSCSRQEAERQKDDLKKPKRKSLTLMEEAREWLESLGKGNVYSTASEKEGSKKAEKRNRTSLNVCLSVDKGTTGRSNKGKARGREKTPKSDLDHQTSCCIGNQTKDKGSKHKNSQEANPDDLMCSKCSLTEEEKNRLRATIMHQLSCLQDLQAQIAAMDTQISELEEKQRAHEAEQEEQQRKVEEEMEQMRFWENELKGEEGYEKELQRQFLEMRTKAAECKAQLEVYISKKHVAHDSSKVGASVGVNAATEITTKDANQGPDPEDVSVGRQPPPQALVPPQQLKERRLTGPTELREWWTRWSEAQRCQSQTRAKVVHRSELTIYLGSSRV